MFRVVWEAKQYKRKNFTVKQAAKLKKKNQIKILAYPGLA